MMETGPVVPGMGTVVHPRSQTLLLTVMVAILLAGLPIAVWLDLRTVSEVNLRRQTADLNGMITSIRSYYANNVVARVKSANGPVQVVHNYATIQGAIPIPATLSLELGDIISKEQANIQYRFLSDFPFKNRAPHKMDAFESSALKALRENPDQLLTDVNWSALTNQVRLISPVIMAEACVACHNTHPESPKKDWKVGDVRGIQEISISQPIVSNIFVFKYLLLYFFFTAAVGIIFISLQRRSAAILERANEFLATIASRISRYLSPQIYSSIFSGQRDVVIHTERKKLTIFFSDLKDFTANSERMPPEDLTTLINEYFTEMSNIALKHGGTIDKFIGDAIVIFFGDPETKGAAEDAKACVRMAIEMQEHIDQLNQHWQGQGILIPFHARMGINTGYCNVGNFGSASRMDYTIIGAEANLAERLQEIAEPDTIVLSFETYTLVKDIVNAEPHPAVTLKGIGHEVVPYVVEGLKGGV